MKRQFWFKFFEVLCLILVIIGLTQLSNAASGWQYQFVSNHSKLLMALGSMLALSFIIALLWQRSNKGEYLHRWFQGIICFYVAYQISLYGAAKLLKTQLQPPHFILDQPMGELSGFWLTWAYFGHSQAMSFILGITQVGGSILLLFRKTRLLGAFILFPVLVNIDLINQFYDISPLAYYNSLHYTFILVFIMMLDYDKLKAAFLSVKEKINFSWKTVLLNIVRVAVIAGAFLKIQELKNGFQPVTKINGEWQVQRMAINNVTINPEQYKDSIWTRIYFEWRYGCVFRYNNDKFIDKDLYGDYKVDEKANKINISFNPSGETQEADSAQFNYRFTADSMVTLNGVYKKDTITVELKKTE